MTDRFKYLITVFFLLTVSELFFASAQIELETNRQLSEWSVRQKWGCSCGPISYIGNSYEPTDNVYLYFSVDDIKMEYTVIGHALGADGWQKNQKKIKEALIKNAKEWLFFMKINRIRLIRFET